MSDVHEAPMVTPLVCVKLPAGLTTTAGERAIVCRALSVGEALRRLVELVPRARELVFSDRSNLRATVILNGLDVLNGPGLATPAADGDLVSLHPHRRCCPGYRIPDVP